MLLNDALRDRYVIERELGRGGMATVYLAQDCRHHRRVAIKVLHPELARAVGSERFLHEIEIIAQLQHPHILPLHDSGAGGGHSGGEVPQGAESASTGGTVRRFERVQKGIQGLAASAASSREGGQWVRLELTLLLAEATGRRIGPIRQLRWSEISLEPPSIRWRAEFDKRRREQVVLIPESLASQIKSFRVRLEAVGDGWVFKHASKDAPWAPAQCQDFLKQAEAAAGIEKLDGGLWHAYRRKWATERKGLPLKDVAAAGGWKDVNTLLTCYQHADAASAG